MKIATYTLIDGTKQDFEYDETAPCRICKKPVVEASVGGTDVCPWCDMGKERPEPVKAVRPYPIQLAEQQTQQLWADGATDIQHIETGYSFKLRDRSGKVDWWGKITWDDEVK